MDNPVVVPHQGQKPEWLEDDAWIIGGVACVRAHAQHMHWRDDNYFLPADHWAAPVLAAGLTPWNPKLQGEEPPKDYAGGKVMLRDGRMLKPHADGGPWSWGNQGDQTIIGYEPTLAQRMVEYVGHPELGTPDPDHPSYRASQPASPPHESGLDDDDREIGEPVEIVNLRPWSPHESAGENDLAIRCDEILSWKKTGIYEGSALQTLADELERQDRVTHISPILSAEKVTIDQALEFTASSLATPDLQAENARLRRELKWYGEQARLSRLIHSEGDAGRNALSADGGERARLALSTKGEG